MSMSSNAELEIEEISQEIISEIEKTSSKELANSDETTKLLHLTDPRHAKKNAATHGKCIHTF